MGARRRIRKSIVIIIVELLFSTGSYEILNFPTDSRSLAISNAASAYDHHILRNNPAALSDNFSNFSYSYFNLPANIQYGMIQTLKKMETFINVNKISLLSYGKILDGETNKTHSAFDLLLTMGYKFKFKHITSFGVSANYLMSSIANHHSNIICLNLGTRSKTNNNRLGFGASLENLMITSNSFSSHNDVPPILFRSALYYQPLYFPGTIHFETKIFHHDKIKQYSIGIESKPINNITIRTGLGWNELNEINELFDSILNNYSFGLGIDFNVIYLDIGFKNLNSSGYIIGISINKKINQK